MTKQARLLCNLICVLALISCTALGAAADFPQGAYSAGEYTITFAEKGQYRVSKGEEVLVEGEYTVKGDQLQVTDKQGPIACKEAGQETGTYGWKYEAELLTLSKVKDACQGRSGAMTTQPWKRKK